MLNISVMDINSTSVPFSFMVCLKGVHLGMVVSYVAMSLCFALGTPAHSWLLWVYFRVGWKIKPTQVFPLNMTILELIYSIQCAAEVLNLLKFNNDMLWRVIFFCVSLSWMGRPLIQVNICIEQYLAVIHPIIFLQYKAVQYRIVVAAVAWLVALACAVYEMFINTFADLLFNSVFFISVIKISFCCVSVLRALKHSGPGDTQIRMERGRDVGNQQKRNAFNTIFSGLLIILFSYLPQVLFSLIKVIQLDKILFQCDIAPILNTFNIVGVMITPLLKIYKKFFVKTAKQN